MGRQTLYVNAAGATRIHQRGFSWFAACLFPIWAVRQRLYWTAAASALYGGLLAAVWGMPSLQYLWWPRAILTLATIVLYGAGGPRWQVFLLRRAGYRAAASEPE